MKKKKLIKSHETLKAFCAIKNETIKKLRQHNFDLINDLESKNAECYALEHIVDLKESNILTCERELARRNVKEQVQAEFCEMIIRCAHENQNL